MTEPDACDLDLGLDELDRGLRGARVPGELNEGPSRGCLRAAAWHFSNLLTRADSDMNQHACGIALVRIGPPRATLHCNERRRRRR